MITPTETLVAATFEMSMFKDAELFEYTVASTNKEETFHFLGFEALHRLNIVRLQSDLIVMREEITRKGGEGLEKEKLTKLLDDYSKDLYDMS